MKADFSGWATKSGIKCTDGRTILPDAFKHQDSMQVPLVWQHGHSDPENVLGHVKLENRPEGVYAYAFFNDSAKAQHAKGLVEHKDINALSIWANQLIERAKSVLHGQIREVSLVLSGANPGALIENVMIAHTDGNETLEDEAIIRTGLELEHSEYPGDPEDDDIEHADDGPTVQDVYDAMTPEQQTVVNFMVGEAIADSSAEHDALGPDATVQDVYDSLTDQQKTVVNYMIGEALAEDAATDTPSDSNDTAGAAHGDQEGNSDMKHHNVFDQTDKGEADKHVLSHDDVKAIVADASRRGSLKHAFEEYAIAHGIDNIDQFFPEAQLVENSPEFLQRRVEWVSVFLGQTRKQPFARIRTLSADITMDEARAKGYVTGAMKKEEFFSAARRTTTPTTIYKKQKLDRDDVIDITDFDVVTWLKAEMRVMLDEEVARAALIGDGRDISNEDKIDEQCIRPIATDSELYTTSINVNILDASSSVQELIDAVVQNRWLYKGTGTPVFFTTETIIAKFLLLKDTTGRRLYNSLDEIATELRCSAVVPVEVLEGHASIVGVIVNPVDYVFGTDRGGEVSMFDFFDIDYNQLKYLMETRCSGALVKLKSALVLISEAVANVKVTPDEPTFVDATGVLTIVNQTGVVYKNGATVVNAAGSPYAAIAAGTSITITATPASGYFFEVDVDKSWTFTRDA